MAIVLPLVHIPNVISQLPVCWTWRGNGGALWAACSISASYHCTAHFARSTLSYLVAIECSSTYIQGSKSPAHRALRYLCCFQWQPTWAEPTFALTNNHICTFLALTPLSPLFGYSNNYAFIYSSGGFPNSSQSLDRSTVLPLVVVIHPPIRASLGNAAFTPLPSESSYPHAYLFMAVLRNHLTRAPCTF